MLPLSLIILMLPQTGVGARDYIWYYSAFPFRMFSSSSLYSGRLRSSLSCILELVNSSPQGQPSMTTPIAGPWLSHQVVIENTFTEVLHIMVSRYVV